MTARERFAALRHQSALYLVASRFLAPPAEFYDRCHAALSAGAKVLQMREKNCDRRSALELGRELRALTLNHGALFIINDDAELAVELDADGVHVGQDDQDPRDARRIVGPDRSVGLSTHSVAQAKAAQANSEVDGIGFGPIFATATKEAGKPLGLSDLSLVHQKFSRGPIFAIGGIDASGAALIRNEAPIGIAVASAILSSADPSIATRALSSPL